MIPSDLLLQSIDLETLSQIRTASEALSIALGLAVSYLAYQGYRRHDSRPMLYIALGFVCILGVPGVLFVILRLVFEAPIPIINSLAQASELVGLAAILYGLWTPRQD